MSRRVEDLADREADCVRSRAQPRQTGAVGLGDDLRRVKQRRENMRANADPSGRWACRERLGHEKPSILRRPPIAPPSAFTLAPDAHGGWRE